MASNRFILLAVLWVALGAGCDDILGKTLNPKFCAAHPDDPRCEGLRCTSSSECGALVCDVPSGECVQCTTAEPDACTDDSPVCGSDNACRPCAAHSECGSEVCGPAGSCIDGASVAFVAPASMGGTDNSACTQLTPCTKVSKALATRQRYVKFSGTTDEGGTVAIDNQNVTLLADPEAKLIRTSNGIVLEVRGTSQVSVVELEISGGSGAQGIGISVPAGSTAKLELARAKILNNAGGGISVDGGSVTVSQSTVEGNAGGGISVDGAETVVHVTNTFIVRNGSSAAAVGGISLRGAAPGSVFALNTVVDNEIRAGTLAGGASCEIVGFRVDDNIIARNFVNNMENLPNSNTAGACTFSGSTVSPGVAALSFESPDEMPFDYHLKAGSTAIDRATTSSAITIDVDGDRRPQGGASDHGADEFKP